MSEKKSFVLYTGWGSAVRMMTDEQAGMLLKSIFDYQSDPEARPNDPVAAVVFEMIRVRMDEDRTRYEETCSARAKAGRAGGKASGAKKRIQKKANEANASFASNEESKTKQSEANASFASNEESKTKQSEANEADNEYEYDNDSLLLTEKRNTRACAREMPSQEEPKTDPVSSGQPRQNDLPVSHGIDLDENALKAMFKDPAMGEAMLTWLQTRAEQGRFPYGSITAAIEQAKAAERKYGAGKCIPVIRNAISGAYKRIIWEELEPRGRSGPPKGQPKGREVDNGKISDLEKRLLSMGG